MLQFRHIRAPCLNLSPSYRSFDPTSLSAHPYRLLGQTMVSFEPPFPCRTRAAGKASVLFGRSSEGTALQIFCKSTRWNVTISPGTNRDVDSKTPAETRQRGTPRDATARTPVHLKTGDPQGSGGSNPSPSVLSRSAAEAVIFCLVFLAQRSEASPKRSEGSNLLSGVCPAAQRSVSGAQRRNYLFFQSLAQRSGASPQRCGGSNLPFARSNPA